MDMKFYSIIINILLTFTGILVVSCNLDTFPSYKYAVDTFWMSEEGAEAAMTGCYTPLTSDYIFGASPLMEETATPNAYNYNDLLAYNQLSIGTHTSNTGGIITGRWGACYEGIGRCNTHLNRISKSDVSEKRRSQMEGEAKFLRALYYYMLVNYYNGVPLILEEPDISHGTKARATRQEVVEAIIKDLNDAASLLDWQWTKSDDIGRATKGAAMALKARQLLFEASPLLNESNDLSKWKEAADAAEALIKEEAASGYSLFPDYRSLFLPENEHSVECVFNVEYSKTKNTPVNKYNIYSIQYRNNAPLLNLVKAYEYKDGSYPSMPIDYSKLDPRFSATIFYPGSTFLGKAGATAKEICSFTGFAHKKLTIYNEQKRDNDDVNGETNFMVIRYADILLMFAEAKNEAESSPSVEIYNALNRVRERAGMKKYISGFLNKDEMREAIRHERRIEFAGEGLYYNDIRRWKTAEIVLNDEIQDYTGTPIAIRSFDPDRDYWWPIPAEQIRLNKELTQNINY